MSPPGAAPVLPASEPATIEAAAAALEAGGVVGLPTETVYGLAVLPRPEPLAALIATKERPDDKGIALLIDDLDQVEGLVVVDRVARSLASTFWPGALTLVLPLADGSDLPDAVTGGRSTLGLRLPDHGVPRSLARALGPLAVSSANISGRPPATTAAELVATVGSSLALVIDDGPVRGGVASTVIAVSAAGEVTTLRAGALAPDEVARVVAGVR